MVLVSFSVSFRGLSFGLLSFSGDFLTVLLSARTQTRRRDSRYMERQFEFGPGVRRHFGSAPHASRARPPAGDPADPAPCAQVAASQRSPSPACASPHPAPGQPGLARARILRVGRASRLPVRICLPRGAPAAMARTVPNRKVPRGGGRGAAVSGGREQSPKGARIGPSGALPTRPGHEMHRRRRLWHGALWGTSPLRSGCRSKAIFSSGRSPRA